VLKEDLMPRVIVPWLVASALVLYSNPAHAQIQRQGQQPQIQQQQSPMQMQQPDFERRRAFQLPGTLVVEKAGTAGGAIRSEGGQEIDCGSRCEYRYQPGGPSQIRLKVTMGPGSWVEWSGACTGNHTECLIPVSADARQRVVAAIHYPRVTVRLHGRGAIAGPNGFVCSGTNIECHQEYAGTVNLQHISPQNPQGYQPPVVHLTPGQGWVARWSRCQNGFNQQLSQCIVGVIGVTVVEVTFPARVNAAKSGDGAGHVTATPAPPLGCSGQLPPGASCGFYWPATHVTLTASGEFTSWTSGPCSGSTTPACAFTVAHEVAASAQFTKPASSK